MNLGKIYFILRMKQVFKFCIPFILRLLFILISYILNRTLNIHRINETDIRKRPDIIFPYLIYRIKLNKNVQILIILYFFSILFNKLDLIHRCFLTTLYAKCSTDGACEEFSSHYSQCSQVQCSICWWRNYGWSCSVSEVEYQIINVHNLIFNLEV